MRHRSFSARRRQPAPDRAATLPPVSDLASRRVLVTGAGGFIGSHLCARLVVLGANVRAFVRYTSRADRGALAWLPDEVISELEVVFGDLRDQESVGRAVAGSERVLHLGAQIAIPYSFVNPRDFFETNVLGTLNVVNACLANGVERLVHVSTSEIYGSAQTVPITENHPVEPQSPYAASKVGADKLVDAFHRSFDLPALIVRPFNTYGPHQSARAIVPTVIAQALSGTTLRLGSLHPRRDLTYVEDTVAGFVAGASAPTTALGRTMQLGTGRDVSIAEVVEVVGRILGKKLEVELDEARVRPEKSEVQRLISDPTLAADVLDWRPTVSLEEGLTKTIAWIERNLDLYRPEEYTV